VFTAKLFYPDGELNFQAIADLEADAIAWAQCVLSQAEPGSKAEVCGEDDTPVWHHES
jgi:hypothetical protein